MEIGSQGDALGGVLREPMPRIPLDSASPLVPVDSTQTISRADVSPTVLPPSGLSQILPPIAVSASALQAGTPKIPLRLASNTAGITQLLSIAMQTTSPIFVLLFVRSDSSGTTLPILVCNSVLLLVMSMDITWVEFASHC